MVAIVVATEVVTVLMIATVDMAVVVVPTVAVAVLVVATVYVVVACGCECGSVGRGWWLRVVGANIVDI